jgi:TrmH family RNA methyltransferase
VVEGPVLVADAVAAGADIETVFAEPGAVDDDLAAALRGAGIEPTAVQAGGLARVLDTVSPRPVAAVVPLPAPDLGPSLAADLVLVLVDVGDPGNLGTLVRTAEAAGAGAVVCCGSTADPFAPKAVRASAGSILRVPVVADCTAAEALAALAGEGAGRIALTAGAPDPYDAVDLTGPVALVLGSEAHGLPEGLEVDRSVSIPMAGAIESLNVATAGAIVCFEAARQRRARG